MKIRREAIAFVLAWAILLGSVSPMVAKSREFPALRQEKISLGLYSGSGPEALAEISQVEQQLEHRFPILHVYTGFNEEFSDFRLRKLEPVARESSIPLISWAPGVAKGVLYKEIAAGNLDSYLRRWAQGVKAWKSPVFIRFAYEMNMVNMDWNATESNGGPEAFIHAWRRIHRIFNDEGVTNVRWVWCPHADQQSPNYTDLRRYYPGDDYVDWIGLDGYHWGSMPGWEAQAFDRVFRASYDLMASRNKPMMIAEMGTPADGWNSGQWLISAFDKIALDYPRIQAVVYFNADFSKRGEKDWRFTQNNETLKAFRHIVRLPEYSGKAQELLASGN